MTCRLPPFAASSSKGEAERAPWSRGPHTNPLTGRSDHERFGALSREGASPCAVGHTRGAHDRYSGK
jgi:hypothetical protein